MAILIKGGLVITADPEDRRFDPGAVLIEGNRIVSVGPDDPRLAGKAERVIDASRAIVLPGLINAHMHSNESFEQGAYENMPLELWLMHAYPPFGMPRLSERDHYLRTMICAAESIRSGVTTIQDDILHAFTTPEAVDGAAAAYRKTGLRAVITVTMLDVGFLDRRPFLRDLVPAALAELDAMPPASREEQIALFQRHFDKWHNRDAGICIIPAPTSPQRCSNEILQETAEISKKHDLAMHIHTDETKTQALANRMFWGGRSLVERLAELQVLSPRLSLNHGIWLTERDIELVGGHGCSVTHNPLSNMKLGSGVCPVRQLLKAGANVALGTDGTSTSDTADLMEALRAASLLHKIGSFDPDEWISAAEAFRMSTYGGAVSTNLAKDIGSLETGKKADVILLDRDAWGFIPLNDPIRQLAYSVNSEAVRTSIINGCVVMEDRRLKTVDEASLKEEVKEAAERFRRDHWPEMQKGAQRVAPYVRQMYEKATAAKIAFGRDFQRRPPARGR